MYILKNVKVLKEKIEELSKVVILDTYDILVDLPVVAVQEDQEIKNPVLFGNYKGIPTVMEYSTVLENTKLFYLIEKDGQILESDSPSDIKIRLPKNTDISKLIKFNDEILLAE